MKVLLFIAPVFFSICLSAQDNISKDMAEHLRTTYNGDMFTSWLNQKRGKSKFRNHCSFLSGQFASAVDDPV
jgi:hypothetical protein